MYKLTIGIPTYNRNKILLRTVQRISDQLEENIELLIIDNNSDTPVSETLDIKNNKNIRIIKNKTNIGGNANLLRCAEEAKGEYLWVLGDDDLPANNALKYILDLLESDKDFLWLNFKSNDFINQPIRHQRSKIYTLRIFLKSLSSISELVFISNNVVKTELIKQGMHYGFLHLDKHFPTGVAAIQGLVDGNHDGSYLIDNIDLFESIGNINEENTSHAPNWPAYVGIMRLIQIAFPANIANEIARLVRGARKGWISNKFILSGLSYYIRDNGRKRTIMHSYDAITSIILLDKFKSVATIPLITIVFLLGGKYIDVIKKVKKLKNID